MLNMLTISKKGVKKKLILRATKSNIFLDALCNFPNWVTEKASFTIIYKSYLSNKQKKNVLEGTSPKHDDSGSKKISKK